MQHVAMDKLKGRQIIKPRYGQFHRGNGSPPVRGQYFSNVTPITGQQVCEIARSTAEDIELALDAAHKAKDAWGKASPAERARVLAKIANKMEENLDILALGRDHRQRQADPRDDACRPCRSPSTTSAISPAAFAPQEGSIAEIDHDTVAYHFHEPLGRRRPDHPVELPAAHGGVETRACDRGRQLRGLEARRADAAVDHGADGASCRHHSPGVINVVNGFGVEAGKPLAQNKRIAKIAFTGETTTGRLIMQYASENIIPCTLELGGKSPNIFFADVMDADDEYFDKCLEGFTMFALNQGEVCTLPEPRADPALDL